MANAMYRYFFAAGKCRMGTYFTDVPKEAVQAVIHVPAFPFTASATLPREVIRTLPSFT